MEFYISLNETELGRKSEPKANDGTDNLLINAPFFILAYNKNTLVYNIYMVCPQCKAKTATGEQCKLMQHIPPPKADTHNGEGRAYWKVAEKVGGWKGGWKSGWVAENVAEKVAGLFLASLAEVASSNHRNACTRGYNLIWKVK